MGRVTPKHVVRDFEKIANPAKAKHHKRFFKTKKGEYGAGDVFYGVTVPQTRVIAKKYQDALSYPHISHLLKTGKHDVRLAMLVILVGRFKKGDANERKKIFDFYLKHLKWVNNWDLVDASAHHIVGGYLHGKPKAILYRLARSKNLWEKRVAMVATFYDIQKGFDAEAYTIADMLLSDTHDLIHKAVGWMLREAGKRVSETRLENYIRKNVRRMPRTALRYAIERFPDKKRKALLAL